MPRREDRTFIDGQGRYRRAAIDEGSTCSPARNADLNQGKRSPTSRRSGASGSPRSIPDEVPASMTMLARATSWVSSGPRAARRCRLPTPHDRALLRPCDPVAIVRPGPIHGNMVHPYRVGVRVNEKSNILPPTAPLFQMTKKQPERRARQNQGSALFQEQAMKLAIVANSHTRRTPTACGRAMATFPNVGTIHHFRIQYGRGQCEAAVTMRDFSRSAANDQIKGFAAMAFPKPCVGVRSRAWSRSRRWPQSFHPAVFACSCSIAARGFYVYAQRRSSATAEKHYVAVRRIDVKRWLGQHLDRASGAFVPGGGGGGRGGCPLRWDCASRRVPRGLGQPPGRCPRPCTLTSIEDLALRANPHRVGFACWPRRCRGSIGQGTTRRLVGSCAAPPSTNCRCSPRPARASWSRKKMPHCRHAAERGTSPITNSTRLSLNAHPMQFLRPMFRSEGCCSCAEWQGAQNGSRRNRLPGVVLVRQRPGPRAMPSSSRWRTRPASPHALFMGACLRKPSRLPLLDRADDD